MLSLKTRINSDGSHVLA